jgi:hypothetical protein
MPRELLNHAGYGLAERRRSRTYQPWGYHGLPVLKTGWATGPVPPHVEPLSVSDRGQRPPLVVSGRNSARS